MDSPLQFLRDWLPFGKRPGATGSGEELRQWLDGLSAASPEVVAKSLVDTMPQLIGDEKNLRLRIKLLDALDAEVERLLPALESAVDASALPLPIKVHDKALAADNLLKVLAAGYSSVIASIETQKLANGLVNLLQHAILHAVKALSRRQLLAYRAYAPASESSWRQLHRLYRIARDRDLAMSGDPAARIETHYVAALLLAFADPTKFSRSELGYLTATTRLFAPLARIIDPKRLPAATANTNDGDAQFVVKLGDGKPGRARARNGEGFAADELIIDCGAIVDSLQREISFREIPAQATAEAGALAAPQPMLNNLLNMWRGMPTRRFSRQRFRPRGDLVVGIAELWGFIAGHAFLSRREDSADTGQEPAAAISEWSIVDESPDGFGIRYLKGEVRPLEVGEIVGLRPRERSKVHVCLVRRVTNSGPTRFELGLQELSPHAVATSLPGSNGAAPNHAILLPKLPGYGNARGLISAPGTLRPGMLIPNAQGGREDILRVGKAIERNVRCEVFLLDSAISKPVQC